MNQKGKPRRDSGNDSLIYLCLKLGKALKERKEKGEGQAGLGKEG